MTSCHSNSSERPSAKTHVKNSPGVNNNNNNTCKFIDFGVLDDHRIKLKKCEKKDKYLDLARELKKLWDMQLTILPIVIG